MSMDENRIGTDIAIPTMKSLYIEMFRGDLKLASGTGFLAANDQNSHCTFITNRHNVTGRDQDTDNCLHSQGAEPDAIVIHFHKEGHVGEWVEIRLPLFRDDGAPYWIEHPRLGAAADLVALNLSWGSDVSKYAYYMDLDLDRAGIYVGPADTVSVIGFPFGQSSFGRFPIWATGFLAQELELVTPDNPVFLIDCRARRGQSGSAVISYRTGTYRTRRADGGLSSVLSGASVWEFLGIYSGRLNPESDLGRVWHVSAVKEVLDAARNDQVRREEAAALAAQAKTIPSSD